MGTSQQLTLVLEDPPRVNHSSLSGEDWLQLVLFSLEKVGDNAKFFRGFKEARSWLNGQVRVGVQDFCNEPLGDLADLHLLQLSETEIDTELFKVCTDKSARLVLIKADCSPSYGDNELIRVLTQVQIWRNPDVLLIPVLARRKSMGLHILSELSRHMVIALDRRREEVRRVKERLDEIDLLLSRLS